jgi:hypothetical protein
MIATDDLRRAQLHLIESHERLIQEPPESEKWLRLGDWVYALRRLCSHLHEAGSALKSLDTAAAARVDKLLAGDTEMIASLQALREFFNSSTYKDSFVARVRNSIGFHYQHNEVQTLAERQVAAEANAAE